MRSGSYVIDHRTGGRSNGHGDSLCGSEHYTDSGIEKADSNQLDEEQRFLNDDLKIIAGTVAVKNFKIMIYYTSKTVLYSESYSFDG